MILYITEKKREREKKRNDSDLTSQGHVHISMILGNR